MDTAAAAAAATTTAAGNPYGLIPLWVNGTVVTRGTLMVLVAMSLGSWFIMFTKLWDQRALRKSGKVVEKQFWTAPSLKDGVERLPKADDYRFIAESGLRAASHHEGRLTDRIDLHEWITLALQRAVEAVNGTQQRRPVVPRDRRFDRTVRRSVRHGHGHSPGADQHRHRRPGEHRPGRRTGRRGADHDGDRPVRRRPRGARLQLAAAS